jgi:hypothetical protein
MGTTTPLRTALKQRLHPHAQARGFVIDKSNQPNFTAFRRIAGDTVQVFEIQWDKYGKARFVINFGDAPAAGVNRHGAVLLADAVEPFDCKPSLRLQRKRGGAMSCWFQLRRPLLEQIATFKREYTPDEVAEHVLACFPEMEEWWSSRKKGVHVNP